MKSSGPGPIATWHPEDALTQDELLDNVMLYWVTGTATSSARLYWESFRVWRGGSRVELPTGIAAFPALQRAPQLVGASQQRHVGGILEVGFANHAGFAGRRALIVKPREAFDPDGPSAAAGQMRGRRRSHAAQADDRDVVPHIRAQPNRSRIAPDGVCRRWVTPPGDGEKRQKPRSGISSSWSSKTRITVSWVTMTTVCPA